MLTLLSTPVLSRLYDPEAFSVWALFVAVGVLLGGISTLQYDAAIILPRRERVVAALILFALAAATVVALAGIPIAMLVGSVYHATLPKGLSNVIMALPVYALAAGCQRVGMGVLIREGRFGRIAWTTALVPGGTTVAQLAFAWAPVSQAMALVMGSIVGMVVSAAVALPPTIGLLRRCRRPELRRIGLAVGRYRRFPLLVLPFHCLEIFTVRGVYLILGRWPNPNLVGWYAFADRLLTAPAALVGASIRPVFANAGSVHDIRSLGDLVTGGVRLIAALAVPGWVVAMVYADWLVPTILGERWAPTSDLMRAIAPAALAMLFATWLDRSFHLLERQRASLILALVFGISGLSFLAASHALGFDPVTGLAGVAAARVLHAGAILVAVYRFAGYGMARLVRAMGMASVLLATTAGVALLLRSALRLDLACIASAAVAACLSGWRANREWRRLRSPR